MGWQKEKNKNLKEMAQTMLCDNDLSRYFQTEAINMACYILNHALIRPILMKTSYELWKDRKPNLDYFHTFSCRCFIHNNGKNNLENFDSKSNKRIFLGYFTSSKAYRVFNKEPQLLKRILMQSLMNLEVKTIILQKKMKTLQRINQKRNQMTYA